MFGVGFSEVIVIGVIALLVLGPDKLPAFARKAGKIWRELRSLGDDARQSLHQAVSSDDDPYPPRKKSTSRERGGP